jgi:hypothetical protein
VTVLSRANVRACVERAMLLGATEDEAVATVAQSLSVAPQDVRECLPEGSFALAGGAIAAQGANAGRCAAGSGL